MQADDGVDVLTCQYEAPELQYQMLHSVQAWIQEDRLVDFTGRVDFISHVLCFVNVRGRIIHASAPFIQANPKCKLASYLCHQVAHQTTWWRTMPRRNQFS